MKTDALLTSSLFVGAVVLALLIADAVGAVLDARRVRDEDDLDALTRTRVRRLSWGILVTAALAVIVAFGADSAVRLVWSQSRPVGAAFLLLGLTVLTFLIGFVAVLAATRQERPTYARIRRDLRDRQPFALDAAEIQEFSERLERADRMRARRSRAAVVLRALGAAALIALAVLAAFLFRTPIAVGFTVGAVVGVAAFVVSLRSNVVRAAALDALLTTQRAEVVALLERARIPARRAVPGLRDRVARALAILREQQR